MQQQYKTLTAAQHQRALQLARDKHDARYRVDYPEPGPEQFSGELTPLERMVKHLWIVWAVLGLAGAGISLPHSLRVVLQTVNLRPGLALVYSLALFVGLELALISVALATELKRNDLQEEHSPKVASLAGMANALAGRAGFRAPFDTSHLPERRPATGGLLVGLLFVASLSFNLADTLADVALLQPYTAEIHLASRIMAGLLGPGLLLIAGHRFAVETVRAASGRRSQESQYRAALEQWQQGLQQSWQEFSDLYIQQALAYAWGQRNPGAPEADNPHRLDEEEELERFFSAASNGNGSRERAGL